MKICKGKTYLGPNSHLSWILAKKKKKNGKRGITGEKEGERGRSTGTNLWQNNEKDFLIEKECMWDGVGNWKEENQDPGNLILKP